MARSCPSCGRHELPAPPEAPPSSQVRDALVEVLRFAREFDEQDADLYSAVDFMDWLAASTQDGTPLAAEQRPDRRENTEVAQRRRRGMALAS